ncbi:MAG: hypothetical protein EOO96_04535 [Pedobacter sp.]|nr:MAG: hypothetical protein EOO96_04535 [Pedobacter sp.]
MESSEITIQKQKNSNLSVALITVNIFLLFIFAFCVDEDNEIPVFVLGIGLNVLLAGYAFTYHGKGYRIGKWIFGIVLLVSLVMFGLLWYATQLGRAFSH